MMEDEGMVIAGLLVGLNVIDCNLCIKEEDLDQPVSTSKNLYSLSSNSFSHLITTGYDRMKALLSLLNVANRFPLLPQQI